MADSEPIEETTAPITPQRVSTKRKANEGMPQGMFFDDCGMIKQKKDEKGYHLLYTRL